MFVTAVCVLFLIKLRWPKKKNFYDIVNQAVCLLAADHMLTINDDSALSPEVGVRKVIKQVAQL